MAAPNTSIPEIPTSTTVLIVGGGPAGSYAASVLAREGVDVVLLEADYFPRYHVGESMLPSLRHFLRFIDLDEEFDKHGFMKKNGAAFKMNSSKREGYTDFLASGGPDGYSWNVVRAESDHMLLKHAARSGARVFEGVKVDGIVLSASSSSESHADGTGEMARRPVGARWSAKGVVRRTCADADGGAAGDDGKPNNKQAEENEMGRTGRTGVIHFMHIIDASGRRGLLTNSGASLVSRMEGSSANSMDGPKTKTNTPRMDALAPVPTTTLPSPNPNPNTGEDQASHEETNRNQFSFGKRTYTQGLKNVAMWAYFRGVGAYGGGDRGGDGDGDAKRNRVGSPLFEALTDESGWAWLIPLHTSPSGPSLTSIGIVQHGAILAERKRNDPRMRGLDEEGVLRRMLEFAPMVRGLVRTASDYSYSADKYAGAGWRVIGDAGAFIDPFFSSGVHLALSGALAAAASICAVIKGEVSEEDAARWCDRRIGVSYTRFLIVVLSAYRQIRSQTQPVLADVDEDNFDRAFAFFRPVIQGAADADPKLSLDELARTIDFCTLAFAPTDASETEAILAKVPLDQIKPKNSNGPNCTGAYTATNVWKNDLGLSLSDAEERALKHVRARAALRTEDTINMANFCAEGLEGFVPRVERGKLGLMKIGGSSDG
ncbi:FAD/NAD(P)-binding domain-containing protein [Rickenella mellea]|uniref:FAD/NAD(P)-binding domain-containing protein n=1 Tax=Rickenella mellea TaxID=50990 RepID=A0A4Y7PUA4_9AGAM|nr:FAD/NAD(P)-binding domain-containing protein [Rickenella mellea]